MQTNSFPYPSPAQDKNSLHRYPKAVSFFADISRLLLQAVAVSLPVFHRQEKFFGFQLFHINHLSIHQKGSADQMGFYLPVIPILSVIN